MKCENCGKNEVSFLYRSSVNGKTEEKRLCAECAEKLGYTRRFAERQQSVMRNFFGNDGFFGGGFLGDGFFGNSLTDGTSDSGARSGGLWDGFFGFPALMGRMLDNPFDDFFADMPALGSGTEDKPEEKKEGQGLVEQAEESRFDRWRRLNALKMEMKKAVHREDFERAAELRDQIHAMEEEHGKSA